MRKLLLWIAVLGCFPGFAQKTVAPITSKKLNGDRDIIIGLPANYQRDKDKKYPLIILLDGDYLFDAFQGTLQYGNYWDDLPECIVVGIVQNKNNSRQTDCAVDRDSGLPSVTGEAFFEFIGIELIPQIEKKYRLAPLRIIAGHDLTAGFLNFYLYKDNPVFDGYISMSPELPVGMIKNIPARLQAIPQNIMYYQSTADGDLKQMQEDIKKLDEGIKAVAKPTLNYRFDDFKAASHYSLVPFSIPSALYSFFGVYQPISMTEFNEKIATLPSGYTDYLQKKYDDMESQLKIKIPVRINDFKAIEAAILKNKAYNELDALSQMAEKSYPKSMLPDYQMGLMYEKKGDYKRATKFYMKAFQREEIGDLNKDMMYDKAEQMKKM